jgi:hypothetical protein
VPEGRAVRGPADEESALDADEPPVSAEATATVIEANPATPMPRAIARAPTLPTQKADRVCGDSVKAASLI